MDKEAKVNLKIYGVTSWETNSYHAQYFKNLKQSDKKIYSVNKMQSENYFFVENCTRNVFKKLDRKPLIKRIEHVSQSIV